MHSRWWRTALLMAAAMTVAACSRDTYESGDGEYSYLQAHYVEAVTNSDKQFVKAVTDEGQALTLTPAFATKWATTPDSTYRALLYHKAVGPKGKTEPVSLRQVPVMALTPLKPGKDFAKDAVSFESAWMSPNGKYLNIAFGLKTGKTEDEKAVQTVGLALTETVVQGDGTAIYHVTLSHDQNGVPRYYTTHHVVSLPLEGLRGTIVLTIPSEKGTVVKEWRVEAP